MFPLLDGAWNATPGLGQRLLAERELHREMHLLSLTCFGCSGPDLATSEVKVTVALPAWWVFSGFFAQSLHLHGPRRGLLTCPPSLLASLQGHWVRRVLERSRRDPLFATPSAAAAALDPTSPAQITATAFPFWPPISLL